MRLSVIIVSWNAKAFLLKCLQSVIDQDIDAPMEILVVDNASSDGSPEAVESAFPAVKVIRNGANLGFARANNIGIRASAGDYLFLINSDVIVETHCFDTLVRYMSEHPAVGIVGPQITGPDGQVQRSCMSYPSLWNTFARALALDTVFPRSRLLGRQLLTFWDHRNTQPVDVINGCFWLLRRAALEQVGPLDERFLIYGEDIDWCRRFNRCGWQVMFYPEATAIHYGGASSANAPVKFYVEMQRATYQYWLKHHSRTASLAFLALNMLYHATRITGEILAYTFVRGRRPDAGHRVSRAWASIKWTAAAAMASRCSNRTLLEEDRAGARVL